MSSGFITAALKLEGTIPVESERFISERIAGPTVGRSSLRTLEGRGSNIQRHIGRHFVVSERLITRHMLNLLIIKR